MQYRNRWTKFRFIGNFILVNFNDLFAYYRRKDFYITKQLKRNISEKRTKNVRSRVRLLLHNQSIPSLNVNYCPYMYANMSIYQHPPPQTQLCSVYDESVFMLQFPSNT